MVDKRLRSEKAPARTNLLVGASSLTILPSDILSPAEWEPISC